MKKEKIKKYETEEQKEIKKFIIVLLSLIIIIIGIYFFTRAFITKDLFDKKESDIKYTEGKINYDVAIVGNMLNRPYEEYYVLAFDSESTQTNYYNTPVSKYTGTDKALKVYHVDLQNELNKEYVATEEKSTSFKSIKELKLGQITLLRVKNGKVTKFLTNIEEIKKEWNI